MFIENYDIRSFIQIIRISFEESGQARSSPFNLRFKAKRLPEELKSAITGTCIYLCGMDDKVIYLGKYQPCNGNIINDRIGRHLQTITGRGADIGFGGQNNPEARLQRLLAGVTNEHLRTVVQQEYAASRRRFRDTGYNTTPNRLRFASECWANFGASDEAILDQLSFTLIRMKPAANQATANQLISDVETRLLNQFRPVCNAEYRHGHDDARRQFNTLEHVIQATRGAMFEVTQGDALACITLQA